MLLESMTELEVHNEIMSDYKLLNPILQKVYIQYHNLRKNLRILKDRPYIKHYPVKSPRNNNWIIVVGKVPGKNYKSINDVASQEVTYYYTKIGFRAFNPLFDLKELKPIIGLGVFNGHFFQRYNERMGLGLTEPVNIMIKYFSTNHVSSTSVLLGCTKSYGVCNDGILLGEVKSSMEKTWLLHRTFITHSMKRQDQISFEKRFISEMKKDYHNSISAVVDPALLKLFEGL